MLQSTEDRLKLKQEETLRRLCHHPVHADVNWEGVVHYIVHYMVHHIVRYIVHADVNWEGVVRRRSTLLSTRT